MQVLSCLQLESDPVTFTPKQEPLVIFSTENTLCVATTQHNVEVYHFDGEQCVLVQTFSTAGIVKQGVFNCNGNYIALLEVRDRLPKQPTNVRIYSNWEKSGCNSPVKARIAGQPPSSSDWDVLSPKQFELIELPLRTSPKCLSCCLRTGNVIVGLSNSLAVFKFVVRNKGTETEYKDFTHLLDILVGVPIKEVALSEQHIAFASSNQLHCFKLTFKDQTQETVGAVETTQAADTVRPQSAEDGSSDRGLTRCGHFDNTASAACVKWNFGSAGYTVPETFMKSIHKPSRSSIMLSSVKHEKLYHEDANHPVEILGPKEKVKGHPVQVKWDEVFLYSKGGLSGWRVQVSVTHLLYKRFKQSKDSSAVENQGPIHSLQLLPTFVKGHSEVIDKDDVNPLGTSKKTLTSLCCFISTSNDGYLYNVLETPCLLSQYLYKADAISVQAGHSLLYALTQNGLEIYTMRSFAAAFQHRDVRDKNILVSPPANLDVCMIGLLPWINITHICVSMDHVTLLSKTKQPLSSSHRDRGSSSRQRASTSWSIEVVHKANADKIFTDMLTFGQRYQNSSEESYLQLLQEGHLILKGALLLSLDDDKGNQSLLDFENSNAMATPTQQLFLKTCSLLGQYYSRPEVEDYHLAMPYYKMSQLSLSQVLAMFTFQDDDDDKSSITKSNQDEDCPTSSSLVSPGPGLISYLDDLLFSSEKLLDLDVDEELSTKVLDIYQKIVPTKVSQLILLSTIRDSLSPSEAMESIEKLNTTRGYQQSVLDILTTVWLHLQLGDLEQANTFLGMLNTDEISQLLVNYPVLLYQEDSSQLTFLAQMIRQQEPDSLFSAMLQILDQQRMSLSTCLKLLQSDEQQPAHDNIHYRQFLERVVADKHRHHVVADAMAHLASIYIERLKLWKPPAVPLYQSSRHHQHMPKGAGCYGERPLWLDSLPPFKGSTSLSARCLHIKMPITTPRHHSANVLGLVQVSPQPPETDRDCPCCCCNEDLLKLQSIVSSKCCPESIIHYVLQAVRKSEFHGSSSLNILCLNILDPNLALGLLVDTHMEVVIDFAMATFNGDVGSWTKLLQLVLMVAKETQTQEKKLNPILLQTLKGVLEYTSNLLDPQDFVQNLPNDGILSFFTPYLEQCCRKHKVKLLQTQIITVVTTDTTS